MIDNVRKVPRVFSFFGALERERKRGCTQPNRNLPLGHPK